MTDPSDEHLAIAEGLERLITMVRVLNPGSELTLTSASMLHRLAVEGPRRLSELAAAEGVTQPAMTQMVTRLQRQGLARREDDPDDRRVVLVAVTGSGRELLRRRQLARAELLSRLLAELPAPDERAIGAALPALARLTALATEPPGRVSPAGPGSRPG